jgi:hypothetical protein
LKGLDVKFDRRIREEVLYCKNCDAKLNPGSVFCTNAGIMMGKIEKLLSYYEEKILMRKRYYRKGMEYVGCN